MRRSLPLTLLLGALALWVAASYGLRFGLMENPAMVGLCAAQPEAPSCLLRAWLGMAIYSHQLGWAALLCSVPAFLLPGRAGRWLAGLALVVAIVALVLYNVTFASMAVVLSGLRLARVSAPILANSAPVPPPTAG